MDASDYATIVIALIGAVAGVMAAVRQWRRDKPDIAETYRKMATEQAEINAQLRKDIKARDDKVDLLECKVDGLERKIYEWESGIKLLVNQLIANHLQPVWIPDDAPDDRDARRERPSRPRPK